MKDFLFKIHKVSSAIFTHLLKISIFQWEKTLFCAGVSAENDEKKKSKFEKKIYI